MQMAEETVPVRFEVVDTRHLAHHPILRNPTPVHTKADTRSPPFPPFFQNVIKRPAADFLQC